MKLAKYTKFREEKFGGVLFDTRSEKVFSLNPTAAALVREIRAGCDEQGLVERLQTRFQGPEGAIEQESRAFIASLKQHGLVED
jgi:hypothetical protein